MGEIGSQVFMSTWIAAGVFSFAAVAVSIYLIYQHLAHYAMPSLQKHIVRILLMVPIYSTDSWLSLRFGEYSIYFDTLRDAYEAFVIYEFTMLLMAYLGGEKQLELTISGKPPLPHPWPLQKLPKMQPNRNFILACKFGTLQYAVIRPVCAIVALFLEFFDMYHDGDFRLDGGYTYICIILNTSVTIALYMLVVFYLMVKTELKDFKAVAKFLCVKSVIFFSYWQSVGIALLVKLGWLPSIGTLTVSHVATDLNDFLICFEMFIAACVHSYAFSYNDFWRHNLKSSAFRGFFNVMNMSEMAKDTLRMLGLKKEEVNQRSGSPRTTTAPAAEPKKPKKEIKQDLIKAEQKEREREQYQAPEVPPSPSARMPDLEQGELEMKPMGKIDDESAITKKEEVGSERPTDPVAVVVVPSTSTSTEALQTKGKKGFAPLGDEGSLQRANTLSEGDSTTNSSKKGKKAKKGFKKMDDREIDEQGSEDEEAQHVGDLGWRDDAP